MPRPLSVCLLALAFSGASSANAEDHYLTIGGGYNPGGNQVSLERNVLFQRKVLAKLRPDAPAPETYFAAGDADNADLQFRDPDYETTCPRARRLMGELFGDRSEVDLRYRKNELGEIAGPSEPKTLRRRFRKLSSEIAPGDRLVIYFTGHGGEAENPNEYSYDDEDYDYEYYEYEEQQPYNEHDTIAYFWDEEEMTASEFADELDRLDPQVTVVMVMVQCFSGGFAHTIFDQADADLGLSDHKRVGFFSQRHDRYSAGCTPDIDEADYQEYSSFFWAALGGETRTGAPITTADYDGDGQVTMAEAHAYAVIESDTIDVPLRTTGTLLRKYSSLGKNDADEDDDDDESASPISRLLGVFGKKADDSKEELTQLAGPLAAIAKLGRPDQRAIIEALTEKIGLEDDATIESVRGRLKQIRKRGAKINGMGSVARRSINRARRRLRSGLIERWPELGTDYSPLAMELCSERADEFTSAIDAMPAFKAYRKALDRYDEAYDQRSEVSHLKAKAERLLRTCENVVLAANLPLIAPEEIVERFKELRELEESPLCELETVDAEIEAAEDEGSVNARPEGPTDP